MPNFEFDLDPAMVINPLEIKEIVSSKNFLDGKWKEFTKHKLFNEPEVQKFYVPIDGTYWNLDVITHVDQGTVIPEHSHSEPVLRYVLKGSFELNGEEYEEGDWCLVPANLKYKIITRAGYTILSRYSEDCMECNWKALSKLPLDKLK